MTSVDRRTTAAHAPGSIAGTARSILSCPAGVNLVVDGVDDVLADITGDGTGELGMQDLAGVPTFSCPLGTRLVRAAGERRRALLTLESGLGRPGSPDRDVVLTVGGRLESRGRETCECCTESRETVELVVDLVVLSGVGHIDDPVRVPLHEFRAGAHRLNRGYLQRSTEHANLCHQDELRRAVSTTTGTRLGDVIGVALVDLDAAGVGVQWVDVEGSHQQVLAFPQVATTTDELGELLRDQLHAGLC